MGIRIGLHLNDSLEESHVEATGFENFPLTDETAKAFGIPRQIVGSGKNDVLWGAIRNWWGRVPDEFVTSDPVVSSSASVPNKWTPYKDSWGTENQVMIERRAVGARIVETRGSVDAVATTEIRNRDNQEQPGQEATLEYSEDVEDSRTTETNWHADLTLGAEVTVGGEYAGFKAEAKRSIEFSVGVGGSKSKTHTVTKGRTVSLKASITAAPRTVYPVSIQAGKGALVIKVDYEYRLHGYWRALYIQKAFNGQLAAPLSDIGELLRVLGKPNVIKDSEIMDIGFVTDGAIDIGAGRPLD